MKICAIIPSFNHHQAIGAIVERLCAEKIAVFIIDDGSVEPARSDLAKLHDESREVIVHRLDRNCGKGVAMVVGFRLAIAAGYSHALQVDADGQHDLDQLPQLLRLATEHPTALISGWPQYDDSIPLGRRIGRWLTHFWVWVETLSFRIPDSMCGFRVYPLAATEEVITHDRIGEHMDFDTEIMVRMVWRGTPVRMWPVKVIYPPGNLSNFALFADNWRITKMHSRLVCGMISRLPRLLLARFGLSLAPSHWATLRERGAYWGLRFCAASYRLLGPRFCRVVIAPIVLYFLLTGTEQRRASRQFLAHALGRPPRFGDVYRHFAAFAGRAVDTLGAWIGAIGEESIIVETPEILAQAAGDSRGALFVVAHLGNVEVSRATLEPDSLARLTILVHTHNAANYNRMLREFSPRAATNLIQVTEIGPETAIALKQRVDRGEWVVIAGDRTPVLSQGRVSEVAFFGEPAAFSNGPWILAALLDCPVYLLFCLRDGASHRLSLEHFAERIHLPRQERKAVLTEVIARYARRLEQQARRDPFQWFNFYDFWAR